MSNLFQLSEEEKNRILGLHLVESKDKRITSVLHEGKAPGGWFGKLLGGKIRKDEIYKLVKLAVGDEMSIEDWKLKRYAAVLNNLDRVFVDEDWVIDKIGGAGLDLDEYNKITELLAATDYWKEKKKPKDFADLLIMSGNFKEGEKYQLDSYLDTAMSQHQKDIDALDLEKHGECSGSIEQLTTSLENIDAEKYPREHAWCKEKLDNAVEAAQKTKEANTKGPRLIGVPRGGWLWGSGFSLQGKSHITKDMYLDQRLLNGIKKSLDKYTEIQKKMDSQYDDNIIYGTWSKGYYQNKKDVKQLQGWYNKASKLIDTSPEEFAKEHVSDRYMFARNADEREEAGNSAEAFKYNQDMSWKKTALAQKLIWIIDLT